MNQQVKRLTKDDQDRARIEAEIRRAAGLLRSHAKRMPEKVRDALREIAKAVGSEMI